MQLFLAQDKAIISVPVHGALMIMTIDICCSMLSHGHSQGINNAARSVFLKLCSTSHICLCMLFWLNRPLQLLTRWHTEPLRRDPPVLVNVATDLDNDTNDSLHRLDNLHQGDSEH